MITFVAKNNFNDLIKMKKLMMLMAAALLVLGGCSGNGNGASKDAGDDQFQLIAGTGHSEIGGAAAADHQIV